MSAKFWVYLGLLLLAGLLSLIFGRKKPKYPQMTLCAANQFNKYIIYAFAILIVAFAVFILAVTMTDESAWEDAGGMLILLFAVLIGLAVLFFILGRKIGQTYVYFDDEKLIFGKTFGGDITLAWHEIGEARPIGRSGTSLNLYDRNGKRCFSANSGMDSYYRFYETAMRKVYGGAQTGTTTPGGR